MRSEIFKTIGLILILVLSVLTPFYVHAQNKYSFEDGFSNLTNEVGKIVNTFSENVVYGADLVLVEAEKLREESVENVANFNTKDVIVLAQKFKTSALGFFNSALDEDVQEKPLPRLELIGPERVSLTEADENVSQFASIYSNFLDGLIVKSVVKNEKSQEEVEENIVVVKDSNKPRKENTVFKSVVALYDKLTLSIANMTANALTSLSSENRTPIVVEKVEMYWKAGSLGSCNGQFKSPAVLEGEICDGSLAKAFSHIWNTSECPNLWEVKEVICQ